MEIKVCSFQRNFNPSLKLYNMLYWKERTRHFQIMGMLNPLINKPLPHILCFVTPFRLFLFLEFKYQASITEQLISSSSVEANNIITKGVQKELFFFFFFALFVLPFVQKLISQEDKRCKL